MLLACAYLITDTVKEFVFFADAHFSFMQEAWIHCYIFGNFFMVNEIFNCANRWMCLYLYVILVNNKCSKL